MFRAEHNFSSSDCCFAQLEMQQLCQLIILYIDQQIYFSREKYLKFIVWEKILYQLCKIKVSLILRNNINTLLHLKSETLSIKLTALSNKANAIYILSCILIDLFSEQISTCIFSPDKKKPPQHSAFFYQLTTFSLHSTKYGTENP